jgi:hypothetical protein
LHYFNQAESLPTANFVPSAHKIGTVCQIDIEEVQIRAFDFNGLVRAFDYLEIRGVYDCKKFL